MDEPITATDPGRCQHPVGPACRALGVGATLFGFLLVVKLCLLFWNVRVKHAHPLGDVPDLWRWAIFGYDMLMCWLAALLMLLLLRLSRLSRGLGLALGRAAPFVLYGGLVFFSVASFQVARVFGDPLDIEHLRSADDLAVMRDSLSEYLSALPLVLLLGGIVAYWTLAPQISRFIFRSRRVTGSWVVSGGVCVVMAAAEAVGLHHIDTMGVKDNAVLFFVKNYKPPLSRIDAARLESQLGSRLSGRNDRIGVSPRDGGRRRSLARDFAWPGRRAEGFNLLFVQLESTSALHVNAETTPNLQRLASHGVSFENHFTTVSYTPRATYAIHYSDYLPDLGTTLRMLYDGRLPQPALAEVMKSAGYRTGLFYSSFLDYADMRFLFENKGIDTIVGARRMMSRGVELFNAGGVREERTVEQMTQWIRAHEREKFFAVYMTLSPHHPYSFPDGERPFPGDSWADRYHNSLHYADRNLGRLVDFLRRESLLDKTVIVVFGDHGETVSTYPVGHGIQASLEELRTPLVISNPELFPLPLRSGLPTNHLDLAPTIAALLGIKPPQQWAGRNLFADHLPDPMLFVMLPQSKKLAVVDDDLLYVWDKSRSRGELLAVSGSLLTPLTVTDPREKLLGGYDENAALFEAWALENHLRRATTK